MSGSRVHPYSPDQDNKMELKSKAPKRSISTSASKSHQASFHNSKMSSHPSASQGTGVTQTNLGASNGPLMVPHRAVSTHLPVEAMGSGLTGYQFWPMAQNLHVMEQQRQWRQQLWLPQPNLMYMAGIGNTQEYIRYMNELRHASLLPLIPTIPIPLSYPLPMQDQPLNLSLKDKFQDSDQFSSELSSSQSSAKSLDSSDSFSSERPKRSEQASESPRRSSPLPVKIHPTKPIEVGSLDPDVARMFPHLRTTDMGSIVLWNFLWALLADDNYQGIIKWIDRPTLSFRVLQPQALARLWGTVKKNRAMNWEKLMKVIDLYLRKNILKQGDDNMMFHFVLIPQSPEFKME